MPWINARWGSGQFVCWPAQKRGRSDSRTDFSMHLNELKRTQPNIHNKYEITVRNICICAALQPVQMAKYHLHGWPSIKVQSLRFMSKSVDFLRIQINGMHNDENVHTFWANWWSQPAQRLCAPLPSTNYQNLCVSYVSWLGIMEQNKQINVEIMKREIPCLPIFLSARCNRVLPLSLSALPRC